MRWNLVGERQMEDGGVRLENSGRSTIGVRVTLFGMGRCAALCLVAMVAGNASPLLTSTVALQSSVNPGAVGQPVTLTATVTAGATGNVTFYDGVSVLGVSALAAGQAKLTTSLLAAGAHTLRAHYGGDATYSPSDATPLTEPVNALPANGFQQVSTPALTARTSPSAVGDFNADGKADLVIATPTGVSVLLGKGDGTFQTPAPYAVGGNTRSIVVADFNGDGIADLAISGDTFFGVLPGKADGTFGAIVTSPSI